MAQSLFSRVILTDVSDIFPCLLYLYKYNKFVNKYIIYVVWRWQGD